MKKTILIFCISLIFSITGCNDDYLERFPQTSIGKENFFNSNEDLNMYVNSMYNFTDPWTYVEDAATDNAATTGNTELKTMMVGAPSSETIVDGWEWEDLRNINYFLENFGDAQISEDLLNHYEGLGRFFRARFYMEKIGRYSNVPWYENTIGTDNKEELTKTQDSREFVIGKVFEDLQFAIDHVKGDQLSGAVNKWVVLAYTARYALYEGTYRKYHGELNLESSASGFLQIAVSAANELMQSSLFSIYNTGNVSEDYAALFQSTELSGNPEIILSRDYDQSILASGWWEFMFGNYEVCPSRDLLQSYLMADGTYYTDQTNYETKQFVEEFANRDPRCYQTFAHPGWELIYTDTYANGAGTYIQELQKNFSGYHQIKGFINNKEEENYNSVDFPVLRFAETLLIYAEAKAELGELTQTDLDLSINVLRSRSGMPNLLLNPLVDPIQQGRYLNVQGATSQWKEVLEIRRERRIEMALEGYREDDLMRWNAGKLLENEPTGMYFPGLGKYDLTGDGIEDILLIDASESIPDSDDKEVNSLGIKFIYYRVGLQDSDASFYLSNGTSGTVSTVKERGTFEEPKYYYRPVPFSQVILNPNLEQDYGWN